MSEKQRLHPIAIFVYSFKIVKDWLTTLLIIFIVNLARFEWNPSGEKFIWTIVFFLGLFLILCLIIVGAIIYWRRFTYWTEDGELHTEHGLFVKKHRFVPFERIQSVNFKEGIFHRPFGLVKVSIETASSEESAIQLAAISKQQAEAIEKMSKVERETLPTDVEEQSDAKARASIYKMTKKDLIILATTSGGIGLIFSALAAVFSQVSDYIPYDYVYDQIRDFVKTGIVLVCFVIIVVLLISWLISVVITYLQYARFEVMQEGKELFVSKGLLELKRTKVSLQRIQAIKIVESPLRQLFGYSALQVESAGNTEEKGSSSITLAPLIKKNEAYALMEKLFPEYERPEQFVKPPQKSLWRYILFYSWFVVLIVIALSIWIPHPYGYLSIVLLILPIAYSYGIFKTIGFAISGQQMTYRTRRIAKSTTYVMKKRIQTIEIGQTVLAESGDLARLSMTLVAGKTPMTMTLRFFEKSALISLYDWFSYRHF